MRRGPRQGTEGQDGIDYVGVLRAPLIGLASGHGPSQHEDDAGHAERPGEQSVLAGGIVVEGDGGKARAVEWRGGVAQR